MKALGINRWATWNGFLPSSKVAEYLSDLERKGELDSSFLLEMAEYHYVGKHNMSGEEIAKSLKVPPIIQSIATGDDIYTKNHVTKGFGTAKRMLDHVKLFTLRRPDAVHVELQPQTTFFSCCHPTFSSSSSSSASSQSPPLSLPPPLPPASLSPPPPPPKQSEGEEALSCAIKLIDMGRSEGYYHAGEILWDGLGSVAVDRVRASQYWLEAHELGLADEDTYLRLADVYRYVILHVHLSCFRVNIHGFRYDDYVCIHIYTCMTI